MELPFNSETGVLPTSLYLQPQMEGYLFYVPGTIGWVREFDLLPMPTACSAHSRWGTTDTHVFQATTQSFLIRYGSSPMLETGLLRNFCWLPICPIPIFQPSPSIDRNLSGNFHTFKCLAKVLFPWELGYTMSFHLRGSEYKWWFPYDIAYKTYISQSALLWVVLQVILNMAM